jgi:iron complex transport system ATP-binding protein
VLKAENVDFSYYDDEPLLHNFKFSVNDGDMIGLIGPNGAGKSTALKILSGYLRPDRGRVSIEEQDISALTSRERAELIAVVSQDFYNPLPFTVAQVVEIACSMRIPRFYPLRHEDRLSAENAMRELDVYHYKDKLFNELSGGEKQRVKAAAALAQNARYLLLDEPTSQLDMGHAVKLMSHLRNINIEKNQTIIIVSHDIQLLSGFVSHIVLMKGGKILASGRKEDILSETLISEAYDCRVKISRDPFCIIAEKSPEEK